MSNYVTAIQRRNGNQIEYAQNDIDDHELIRKKRDRHQRGIRLVGEDIQVVGIDDRHHVDDGVSQR